MTVSELDAFLRNCFVEKLDNEPIDEGSFMKLKNITEITPVLLKAGYEIKAENRKTLRQSLLLGHWLERTKAVLKKSNPEASWDNYLKNEILMEPTLCKKLPELSFCFFYYPKFRKLGISIHSLYEKRKLILKYMQSDVGFRKFW